MPSATEKLAKIASSGVVAIWEAGSPGPAVDLHLPHEPYLGRNAFVKQDGVRRVWTGSLSISDPELRGNGIGERLNRALTVLALKYDYPLIDSHITSEYALDIKKRIFGEDRLSYVYSDDGRLPGDFGEARAMLVAFGETEAEMEHRKTGIQVTVNLEGLDVSGWEVPHEVTRYGKDIAQVRAELA
jgi:hypothetical protein